MDFSMSISNTVSKGTAAEEMSFFQAYLEDEASRLADGIKHETISNEKIQRGNIVLNTYQVTSDAIHGGMGSVWRVHHKIWDVDLAMKRPQPKFFAEGSGRRKEEFIEECQHWIDLGLHPNVVTCYYVRDIGGVPTIFSECMDGGSLKDRILEGSLYEGTESEIQGRILDIAIQTARGLRYSHDSGLVHQDIKPGNILVSKEWDAKIADFGLAKAQKNLEDKDEVRMAENETPAAGHKSTGYTLAYCPTEQAAGAIAEPWMDVYAWAVTVLEMFAGRRQWDSGAEVPQEVDRCFAESKIFVPEELRQLLRECLQGGASLQKNLLPLLDESLQRIYRQVSGHTYARTYPETVNTGADNLNNYALSMLDLGHEESALAAWNRAVQIYPDHLESAANRAFYLWRSAVITDTEVLDILKVFPETEEKSDILTVLALECGEKKLTGSGITDADKKLPINELVHKAIYESNERVWLAKKSSLTCFDTASGTAVEEIRREQAGTELTLLTLAGGNKVIYSGSTGHIVRIDMEHGNKIEEVELVPASIEESLYPDETRNVNGKERVRYSKEASWYSIWLEENDTILCLSESSKWADSKKMEEFRFWCNHPLNRVSPVSPYVPTEYLSHVLRYRLSTPLKAELISVTPLTERESAKPKNEATVYGSRLRDAETGRVLRSHKSKTSIIAFSPDRNQYLLREGNYDISSKKGAYLCTVPENISGNLFYTLSHIKSIKTVQEEDEKAEKLYASFCRAFEASQYKEAIRYFDEYRDIPGRQESETLLEMENRLSKVCRRTRLHHFGTPPAALEGFDQRVFEPVEIQSFFFRNKTQTWKTKRRDDLYHPLYSSATALAETIDRTTNIIKEALPIRYIDDSGEKKMINGDSESIYVDLVDLIKRHSYAWIDEKPPHPKTGRHWIDGLLLDVDMKTGKIAVLAKYYVSDGYPLFAPDGSKWLLISPDTSGKIKRFDKDKTGCFIEAPQGEARFSPDSEFILLKPDRRNEYCIAGIAPKEKDKASEKNKIVELPALPDMMRTHSIYYSADGLLLLLVDPAQKTSEPWLRLYWDYEPREDAATAGEQKKEKQKPKGLFARIFGR